MRGVSIRLKLPLLIGALLLAVIAVYSTAAHQGVRRASVAVASERLQEVTTDWGHLIERQGGQLRAGVWRLSDTAAVRDYFARPGERSSAPALAVLEPRSTQAQQQTVAAELWSADGHRLLGWGESPLPVDSALLQAAAAADSAVVGRYYLVRDTVVYSVVAAARSTGETRGFVVVWRRLVSTPESRRLMNRLMGRGAHLYLGNADGTVWTDLFRRVSSPPVALPESSGVVRYERPLVGAVFAAAHRIAGTPWVVLVEFPRAAVLGPARLSLRSLVLIGAGILAVGLLGAWALSLAITRPLGRLTRAAEAMAAGDYGQHFGASAARRDELGRLAGAFDTMVAHVRDSQHRLEERVAARTAELQERNEELEAFAYSISHDLRAPLRAMEGFSRALLEDYGPRLDDVGRGHAERVVAAARRMDELIRDLLAYSKITRAELRSAPVDLARLVRKAADQVQAEAGTRGARIVIEEPLPPVRGHEGILGQVITNLLGNGIKFVAPDRAPEMRVRSESGDGRVRLWVEDNGIGIAPEYQERIFGVFERLHGATEYPGTGIGLAIVRKGVERMGGRTGVESAPGRGSRFWIDLPAAGAERDRQRHSAG